MEIDQSKKAAGYAAAELVKKGMKVGLGTGSTAEFFILRLGERCRDGLQITALASSKRSLELARQAGIPLADLEEVTTLDLVVDGADEIDPQRRMIKGGGGALLREKIIAHMGREMIVIIDSTKQVAKLGKFPLAVEIVPFAWHATVQHLNEMQFSGKLRMSKNGDRFITDNGNYIYDISLKEDLGDPLSIDRAIRSVPGAIETGFFFNAVKCVIIGHSDGRVEFQDTPEG